MRSWPFWHTWFSWKQPIRKLRIIKGNIKSFWQRGKNGFAVSDTWDTSHYLAVIIPKMLRTIAEKGMGYPWYSNPEDWKNTLISIAEDFEYYNMDTDKLNKYAEEYNNSLYTNTKDFLDNINNPDALRKELFDRWYEEEKKVTEEQRVRLRNALEKLTEIYDDLWD